MSPDWSAKVEPVPYAKLGNPQSLNLYSYVWNNPLSRNDPDGHYTCADSGKCDSANDKVFQGRLDNLKAAQGTFKEGSKEYKQIGKILAAYGGSRCCQGNLEMSHREQLRNVILVTFLRARWGSCV